MTHRLSSDQFQENVDRFAANVADQAIDWDTPRGASSQCWGASCSFATQSYLHPSTTHVVRFTGFRGDPSVLQQGLRPEQTRHHVNVTDTDEGQQVVDWTARQFDPSANFPHVEPLDEYRKRWDTEHEWTLMEPPKP
jgi:hypothetical protein